MLRHTLILSLGLLAAITLGCEKKKEAPAAADKPDTAQIEKDADKAMDEAKDTMEEAKDKAGEVAEEAKDKADDAVDAMKKATE